MMTIGTARIDITPPVGVPLLGYSREQPAQGILDRLYAIAFVLTPDDGLPHLLLSIDHAGMIPAEVEMIQQQITTATGLHPHQMTLFFTHTHAGPYTTPTTDNPLLQAYMQTLYGQLVQVTQDALAEQEPCHAGWGMIDAEIGVNRRQHTAARLPAAGAEPAREVDKRLGVLKLSHADENRLLGLLVIATAHPNVLKGDNLLISADFPGRTRQLLRDAQDCPVMVIIGSAGDCNARWRGDEAACQRMAETISERVQTVLPEIVPQPVEHFAVCEATVTLPLQDVPSPERAKHLAETAAAAWDVDTGIWLEEITALHEAGQKHLTLHPMLQSIEINEGTITGIPMEPFASYALNVRRLQDNPLHFFVGYMNGWIGYLPSADEIPCGGYEIEWNPVVYGHETDFYMPLLPEAEARMLDAIERLTPCGDA